MYKLSFPKICLMLVCLSSTFFGTTEERFQDIRNKVDRSFNNDAIECVDGFSSSGYPVEVIARDLIEELGDSYATMLVLMKCLDTQVFATPEKKENIRKVAMYIMLTSDPATINPITPGLENINTFVAKLFPESGIANNFDNYLKYLEFEMLDPSQISREELRQPGDEDQIKNAVEQRICGIKFRNMILGPKNRALSQLRISDEEINKIKEDERELFYRRKTSNAHEKMVKDAIANRKRCGGPIKDYDQFERSALLIVKAFSKAFSDSYALDNDVRTVNEQIQRAEELPDVGAIQINDEKTALACAPVIRLANLFFDAEYCNRFLDEIGPNASYGIAHYLKKEYLRDLLTKDRETLEVVTPASRSRVIFPLRLDLCGNYHTSYSSDVWMVINPASYNYCWKAHVSAYPSSASRILGVVSGCFKTGDPTFKLNPTNWRMRNLCLESLYPSHVSGKSDPLGITQFGKWLTYYPRSEAELAQIVNELKGVLDGAVTRGVIKPERDFVPLVGDARVGRDGGVFIRDESCCRHYPNYGSIPQCVNEIGDLFFFGQPYKTGFGPSDKPHVHAHDTGITQTPNEMLSEINNFIQEKDAVYTPEEWHAFEKRFNEYREKRGLITKCN